MVNQKLGDEMVWNFRGSDGVVVPTAESSNAVGLGPFGRSAALDVLSFIVDDSTEVGGDGQYSRSRSFSA